MLLSILSKQAIVLHESLQISLFRQTDSNTFTLAVSTNQPIIGDEFTIQHTLTFKQHLYIRKLRLRLHARIYSGTDEYGRDTYVTKTILSHETPAGYGDTYAPLRDEFTWQVPNSSTYLHTQWSIEVDIHPADGAHITAKYPITLITPGPAGGRIDV